MSTTFTTREAVERLYSLSGVALRTDDLEDETAIEEVMDEIIAWATETIASYTLLYYDTEELANSKYIQRRATILAAYMLSQRRANAPQFVAEAKRVMEDLEKISKHEIIIPDASVRTGASTVPAASSHRIDDRYIMNKQRVVKSQSTQPYAGQQTYDLPFTGNDFI